MFVLSALPVSGFRIYWIWTVLSVVVGGLLLKGLRDGRGLGLTNGIAAVMFLATYVLYWVAISMTTYSDTPGGALVPNRIENLLYLIAGNFQQGQVWNALGTAYVQLLMPCIQVVVLVASFMLGRARTEQSGPG